MLFLRHTSFYGQCTAWPRSRFPLQGSTWGHHGARPSHFHHLHHSMGTRLASAQTASQAPGFHAPPSRVCQGTWWVDTFHYYLSQPLPVGRPVPCSSLSCPTNPLGGPGGYTPTWTLFPPLQKNGWPSAFFHFLNACGWIAKRPPGPRCPVSTLRDRQLQRGRCRGSSCEPIHSPQGSPTCPFFPFFPLFSLAYRAHPPFSRRHPKVGFSLPCTLGGGAPVRTSESSPDRFPHPVPLQATPKKADGHP